MSVLADTSAWVELLRRTGSPVEFGLRQRLKTGDIVTTDVVIMEVLAGATAEARRAGIDRALNACVYYPQRRLTDAVAAAELYHQCRRAGETPRQLTDCLIAAIALRVNATVLHNDRDYDVIARHTGLSAVRS